PHEHVAARPGDEREPVGDLDDGRFRRARCGHHGRKRGTDQPGEGGFEYLAPLRRRKVRRYGGLTRWCGARRHDYLLQTPAISPVLSAKLFSSNPVLLRIVRCRFVSAVCSGSSTCCPPCRLPHAPPT